MAQSADGLAAPAGERPPRAAPPDLVLLRDGGMLRGTIIESRPRRGVVIQLATGEIERVPADQIRFAGRAADAPRADSAETARPEPRRPRRRRRRRREDVDLVEDGVRVRFLSDERLTLHLQTSSATASARPVGGSIDTHTMRAQYFGRICTAPCIMTIDPGVHSFAVTHMNGSEQVLRPLDVERRGTLRARWVYNDDVRVGGGFITVLGLLSAVGMGALGIFSPTHSTFSRQGWNVLFTTTAALNALLVFVAGLPMLFAGDGAVLSYEPADRRRER